MQTAIDMSRTPAPNLRKPIASDGAAIWALIQTCKPLDENSMYCNLIQCDHFRDTCVLAKLNDQVVGWISAYLLPDDPQTLFVWQVAVAPSARGLGLGSRMLRHLLNRDACQDVTQVQTTITSDNDASWSLFRRFSDRQEAKLSAQPHFTRDTHFQGQHATEHMVTIALPERMKKAA